MRMEKCSSEKCGKEFSVTEIGGGVPGGEESEQITCPYCYTLIRTERTSGTFRASPLDK
jgi:DNA-directed RNA polymerase subunit RPC12/RpoP